VTSATVVATSNGVQSPADFDDALDQLFASDTRRLPPVPNTLSREDIYFDHD
jgi:hypothetical protein